MEDVEERAFTTFAKPPRYWKRFVDDTFCIMNSAILQEFFQHINKIEKSIKFTMEKEENSSIAFLDINVTRREDGSFKTSIYRKPTHTNRYLNFQSNHPNSHKRSVVNSLINRAKMLVSDERDQRKEINLVKKTLRANGYSKHFLRDYVKTEQMKEEKPTSNVFATIPYVKGFSEKVRRILEEADIRVSYRPTNKLGDTLSKVKDKVDLKKRKGIVYCIPCKDCKEVYIGETKRSFATRCQEHQRDIGKCDYEKSALSKHAYCNDHRIDWEEATILEREDHYKKRLFLESYHINSISQAMNDKKTCMFPAAYQTIFQRR